MVVTAVRAGALLTKYLTSSVRTLRATISQYFRVVGRGCFLSEASTRWTRAALTSHSASPRVTSLTLRRLHGSCVKVGLYRQILSTRLEAWAGLGDRYHGRRGQQRKLAGTSPTACWLRRSSSNQKDGTWP